DDSTLRTQKPHYAVRSVEFDGVIWYLLHWDNLSGEVGLRSATDVLHLHREGPGPAVRNVIRYLLDSGIPFNTFIRAPYRVVPPPPKPRFSGLGFRPANYPPSGLDWIGYQHEAQKVLRSPRGRAALMAGGILGRIAKDFLDYDCVFLVPLDEDVVDGGVCYQDTSPTSDSYWDDALTEDEIRIVCGTYSVAT
ncbi:hypothetical protein DXG01_015742, partial [Tephrocybe rancida]